MATVTRGKILRGDLANWDGKTATATRVDATGGTLTGLAVGNSVDVLQVHGAGTNRTRGTIASAVQTIGSTNVTLVFAPGTWTIDVSLTIPSNFTCHIPAGCIFSVDSGITLTFSGSVIADSATFYSGAGTTVLGSASIIAGEAGFNITTAEAAGVTPTDYTVTSHEASGMFDLARYGILGTASDVSAEIQAIINMVNTAGGGTIRARKPTTSYNLGTTGITVPARVKILGDNEDAAQFLYSGTGIGIDCSGSTLSLENVYLVVTTAAGNGIRFGNVCRRAQIQQVTVQNTFSPGSGRTGAGFWFRTLTGDTAFSGDFSGLNMYSLGFKFGAMFDCFETAEKTWTSCVFSKLFLIGPGAGVCAGSIGIWCDSTSNMIGSSVFGGTIEGFEVPIQVDSGAGTSGINYYGDIEGNTTDNPSLAASASCEVVAANSGKYYRTGANSTTNQWLREQHLNGVRDVEP